MTVSSVPCRQGSCSGGRQCHEHLLSSSQLRKLTQINWILVVKSFGTQNALALWKEMAMSFGFLGLQFSSATAGINIEQPLPPIFLLPPENFLNKCDRHQLRDQRHGFTKFHSLQMFRCWTNGYSGYIQNRTSFDWLLSTKKASAVQTLWVRA